VHREKVAHCHFSSTLLRLDETPALEMELDVLLVKVFGFFLQRSQQSLQSHENYELALLAWLLMIVQ
jgi:hypothetical protein